MRTTVAVVLALGLSTPALGIAPTWGRAFAPDEYVTGSAVVIVLHERAEQTAAAREDLRFARRLVEQGCKRTDELTQGCRFQMWRQGS